MKSGVLNKHEESLHSELTNKYFGINDFKVFAQSGKEKSIRQLRYWLAENLVLKNMLPNKGIESGWDKFNFYEFMWILLIKELKELNFSNTIIQKTADKLSAKKDKYYPMLEIEKAIFYSFVSREPAFFILNKEGESTFRRPQEMEKICQQKQYSKFVAINIQVLVKEFLVQKEFLDYIVSRSMLKSKEAKALELLQNNGCSGLIISTEKKEININPSDKSVVEFIETIFSYPYKAINIKL